MEYFSPQRARPVRDADGLIWRSGAHLAASILFEDKKEFQSLDADTLIRRLLNGVKLHQHTPETAGAFARLVLSNSMARAHLGLKTAPFVGLVDDQFCQCALVAAGLLQLTQHPRLHRVLLDKIKKRKGDDSCVDMSIARRIARIARHTDQKRCRQIAIVALCSLEDLVTTGESARPGVSSAIFSHKHWKKLP